MIRIWISSHSFIIIISSTNFSDMLQQLNQSVDPCEDFYQYACGGWMEKNPLKEGETSSTGFSIVSEKNYNILKEAVETSWMNYDKVVMILISCDASSSSQLTD